MPRLSDYVRLAPFSIDELVEAANSVMRDRPRLQVNVRTVRYYISKDLMPRPSGAPKLARYGFEHLVLLVGFRALQDIGRSLDEARRELRVAYSNPLGAAGIVEDLLEDRSYRESPPVQAMVAEPQSAYLESPPVCEGAEANLFSRIPLTQFSTLEINSRADFSTELRFVHKKIEELIQNLPDSA